jgi:hypothetical protein
MHRLATLLVLLISIGGMAAQTVHRAPIAGSVHNSQFNFTHSSDWEDHEIFNTVKNNHDVGLVVFWPEGGITRPEENPIGPGEVDQNSSYCPEDKLSTNLNAKLYYGPSATQKNAGVYTLVESSRQNFPSAGDGTKSTDADRMMNSEILAQVKGEAVRIDVHSELIGNEFVQYVFDENKPINFALNVQSELFKYFNAAKVPVVPGASEILKFGSLRLREQIPNFKLYAFFKPVALKSFVKFPAKSVQIRRQLLFLVDQDMRILASGFVTLHVSTQLNAQSSAR